MKGISTFVATVLLIGFTVAVGAIISAWFLTYTRTTTAGVGTATACATGMLDVTVPMISDSSIVISSINRGNLALQNVTLNVICGGNIGTILIGSITPGSINVTTITLSGCLPDYSNIQISASATCVGGGITSGGCSRSGCRP
ncbi:MAG: archaellin/type IV pilin N-terminal domain-containing protein [Candidatus Aenigmarchaeota archaeon]|nr:hypothetical protein [Candidatus Aenigmarchaeota archaeon]MDW8159839.1 archaellin/type IV pilin N-terminal domain-containing protein [Candidatus Aenigmarchaeota archaeon]